jgi:hypothetical protein
MIEGEPFGSPFLCVLPCSISRPYHPLSKVTLFFRLAKSVFENVYAVELRPMPG